MSPSKVDVVYEALRAEIESGQLAPGTALGEVALVERLGFSRTPVRDALKRLIGAGLATREGARGTVRVSMVSAADVRHLYALRRILESAAQRELAGAVADGRVAKERLEELRTAIDAVAARPAEPARTDAFHQLAADFDRAVVELTPNPLLGQAVADLRPRTARLRSIARRSPERELPSIQEHLAMLDALLAGDPARAERACIVHLDRTMVEVLAGANMPLAAVR